MANEDRDLVSKLPLDERAARFYSLRCVCPDDGKYSSASEKLVGYLSAEAEWRTCAFVQRILLETRLEFGGAKQENVDEVVAALDKVSPLNMALLEAHKDIRHDQLAVIEEIGRFTSKETKALLHPGTTSYDILDTVRSYLMKKAWHDVIRRKICEGIEKLCKLSEETEDVLQVGRTHLKNTSPVPLGLTFSIYAARMADRVDKLDDAYDDLRGKISGIVGTGASIDVVIGQYKSIEFEKRVLQRLGLEPDYTATQITSKERMVDVGHGLTTLMHVLGSFGNDMRLLYSDAIGEVDSRDSAARLAGSSADAGKNNPINWENMAGKAAVVESGMRVLYAMMDSNFQRDLRNSVQARYQPGMMMAETYEAFTRLSRELDQLSINRDRLELNLLPVRQCPSEAMTAILRGVGFVHSKYGEGHKFVAEMAKQAKRVRANLVGIALKDAEFEAVFDKLPGWQREILEGSEGGIENYTGSAIQRAGINRDYCEFVVAKD